MAPLLIFWLFITIYHTSGLPFAMGGDALCGGGGAPFVVGCGGGALFLVGPLKYFTPNIDIWALFDHEKKRCLTHKNRANC